MLRREADRLEQLLDRLLALLAVADPVDLQRVADDRADALARVQARVRDPGRSSASRGAAAAARGRRACRSTALEDDLARGRLEQPHDRSGRASTCRSRTRRRGRASRPRRRASVTSSTACTRATSRESTPFRIGKYFLRFWTSTSGAAVPARSRDLPRARPRSSARARRASRRRRASSGRGGRGSSTRFSSRGSSMHFSNACGQRGRNLQPCGEVDQRRRRALDRVQPLRLRPVEPRDRAEQAPGVRVLRVVEDVALRAALDDAAGVHDDDLVGDLGDDAEVVRDQDHGRVEVVLAAGRSARGSAPGSSRRAPSSARRRSGRPGCTRAPSRSSRAGACRPRTGADSRRRATRRSGCRPGAAARSRGASRPCLLVGSRASGSPRRSGRRPCRPGSATSSGPGRSSRSRCRGRRAAATRTARAGSRPL